MFYRILGQMDASGSEKLTAVTERRSDMGGAD